MSSQPLFVPETITAQQAGWDAPAQSNFDEIQRHISLQPSGCKTVSRLISNKNPQAIVYLGDFDPAQYLGCQVWITDATGDANNPAAANKTAYSDGTNWRYWANNSTVTIG